jgi:hypothetical protein
MSSSDLPIPGSVLLIDEDKSETSRGNIVLLPKPSNDVNDPLNWSKGRKQFAFVGLLVYTFTIGIGVTALDSVLTPISQETGISIADLKCVFHFLLLSFADSFLLASSPVSRLIHPQLTLSLPSTALEPAPCSSSSAGEDS